MKKNNMGEFLTVLGLIIFALGGIGTLLLALGSIATLDMVAFLYLLVGAFGTCVSGGILLGIAEAIKISHLNSERINAIQLQIYDFQNENKNEHKAIINDIHSKVTSNGEESI